MCLPSARFTPPDRLHCGRSRSTAPLMHPFETVLAAILERGELPAASDFGGWDSLLEAVEEIGCGLLMPEFLKLAIAALEDAPEALGALVSDFICRCIEAARDDFVLIEIVDLLDEARPLPDNVDDRCFARFLAASIDRSLGPMGRAATLDGAFRWALDQRQRQLRLLAALLDFGTNDHPLFLPRLAKIMGVAYSHWREDGLVEKLRTLTEVEVASVEAAFELGVAKLASGFDAHDTKAAAEAFAAARYWFEMALAGREERPDASAYFHGLEMLDAFVRHDSTERLEAITASIHSAALQMDVWNANETDTSWLGARHVEQACWSLLALKLSKLTGFLNQASWWEPPLVIKQYLLAAYMASRCVLRRSKTGGVEAMVRPRLEQSLAQHEGQAHALKLWLRQNADREWRDEANELDKRIDALVAERIRYRTSASSLGPASVSSLIETTNLPDDAKQALHAAVKDSWAVLLHNMSAAEMAVYSDCEHAVSDAPDFSLNVTGRQLFRTVLLLTIRFLQLRLEMTQGNVPGVAYLFETKSEELPDEAALQIDYHQFMVSAVGASCVEIEVPNIGGGRADLRFKSGGERLVVEVKKESVDCTFNRLSCSYAGQASDYQNINIRLGILLVLDLTEIRTEGTPHISTLTQATRIVRTGETEPRWVVIVKVPARRLLPSDLSKPSNRRLVS